jgi:hypothetical protein
LARRLAALALAGALTVAGCGGSSGKHAAAAAKPASTSSTPTTAAPAAGGGTQIGAEGVALEPGAPLAPASTTLRGTPAHGISCLPVEQLAYHIHAHLAIYVNGHPRQLPAGIGIPGSVAERGPNGPVAVGGSCIYWLHTHVPDGIVHIESPTQTVYRLGDFFAIWNQPLSARRVGPARGAVTAFVDGRRIAGDPAQIALLPHAVIQLDVGKPVVAPQPARFTAEL